MPFVIDETIDVATPPAVVWQVVTDLARYGEWNPFVVACRSTLVIGDPIEMSVRLLPGITQPQREIVLAHDPGERLCYGLDGGATGAIVSRRCHEVAAADAGGTRYRSRFELSGWLAPVVRGLLGGDWRTVPRMTTAIRASREGLARPAPAIPRARSATGSASPRHPLPHTRDSAG